MAHFSEEIKKLNELYGFSELMSANGGTSVRLSNSEHLLCDLEFTATNAKCFTIGFNLSFGSFKYQQLGVHLIGTKASDMAVNRTRDVMTLARMAGDS